MRRLALAISIVAVLSLATNALAATTASRYRKLWAKSVADKSKPKVGCFCLATGALGALIFIPGDDAFAYCGIPSFNPDGSLAASTNCDGAFAVLPK